MTKKKKLILALAAFFSVVAIVVISVLGTIAYLTSSSTVTNTFTIGNVSITMTESKVDNDGTPVDGGATQVISNTYTLMPGTRYTKDPKITVSAGSSESYLFVMVRNDIKDIERIADDTDYQTMEEQMIANGWKVFEGAHTATSTVYVYCGNEGVEINTGDVIGVDPRGVGGVNAVTIPVFNYFEIQSEVENLSKYNSATIVLRAFAVQTSGFVDDEDLSVTGAKTAEQKAWAALLAEYEFIWTT